MPVFVGHLSRTALISKCLYYEGYTAFIFVSLLDNSISNKFISTHTISYYFDTTIQFNYWYIQKIMFKIRNKPCSPKTELGVKTLITVSSVIISE